LIVRIQGSENFVIQDYLASVRKAMRRETKFAADFVTFPPSSIMFAKTRHPETGRGAHPWVRRLRGEKRARANPGGTASGGKAIPVNP
jgi:hypothetical protein